MLIICSWGNVCYCNNKISCSQKKINIPFLWTTTEKRAVRNWFTVQLSTVNRANWSRSRSRKVLLWENLPQSPDNHFYVCDIRSFSNAVIKLLTLITAHIHWSALIFTKIHHWIDDGRLRPLHEVFPSSSKRFSVGLKFGLCGDQSMCENYFSCSLSHSYTIQTRWILAW